MYTKLTKKQVETKRKFIENYIQSHNAASGSLFDSNANVSSKNIATLETELNKDINIQINRELVSSRIAKMFGEDLALEYIRQIEDHEIYVNDETSLKPYTYSAKEVISVVYKGKKCLISFEKLYDLCNSEEILEDKVREVYVKYPTDMFIHDLAGLTEIKRLVRKKRHRDLVRVKTVFGEDLVVTDNHPLIISEDKNDTVEAVNSEGKRQLRSKIGISFSGIEELDLSTLVPNKIEQYSNHFVTQIKENCQYFSCPNRIKLSEKLGYFVGFFIGDGNFNHSYNKEMPYITITQKDRQPLVGLSEIIYEHFGISGVIYEKTNVQNCHALKIFSPELTFLMAEVFKIGHMAQNKNLPVNIFEYNEEFAKGIIQGLIDSDGNVKVKENICSIRLSSRYCIQQLSFLLKHFNFGVSNSMQATPFGNNLSHKTNYTIWGVSFSKTDKVPDMRLSFKWKRLKSVNKSLKYTDGWSNISKVTVLPEGSFLEQNDYIYDITTDTETFICNNLLVHNCVSVSMYPLLFDGLTKLGGESKAPQHLASFCGTFVNFLFSVSSQFSGAVAAVEVLMYFQYFAKKDYGENYLETNKKEIENELQHIVYAINQPAAARGYQAVFFNLSLYDKYYFEALFGDFRFPDGSSPNYEEVHKLQKFFMKWFNKEREKAVLTFPVITAATLTKDNQVYDKDFEDFCAEELSEGNSFFIYQSDNADTLSSCCRLQSKVADNTFSYSLGAGGVSTGSINVITLNMNRIIQQGINLSNTIDKVHKYQIAYRSLMTDYKDAGMLPVYDAGFISLDKQFLTIGINGMVEAAEYLGIEISDNDQYREFISSNLKIIYDKNKKIKEEYGFMFNTEFVPAENLGVKNAGWDKKDGLEVNRDCYNSYFYAVEDSSNNILDKFKMHGNDYVKYLDGGSAYHCNLEEYPTKEGFKKLLNIAASTGCNYFCFNVKVTVCNDCDYINKHTKNSCIKCGSNNVDHATRIIGYLKKVTDYSKDRQKEEKQRYYAEI